jgi:hypothetical protein
MGPREAVFAMQAAQGSTRLPNNHLAERAQHLRAAPFSSDTTNCSVCHR